jgi:hypothetical protein
MSSNSGSRLEADSLSTIKSTFNFSRRARPPPPTRVLDYAERTPLGPGAAKLSRRESRGGLRSIFTRNKTNPEINGSISPTKEAAVAKNVLLEISPSLRAKTDVGMDPTTGRVYAKSTASTPERKATLRMTMMSKSTKTRPVSRGNPKQSPKSVPKPPRRTLAAWDPPPLFQAYPQAIKHAQLSSSTLSADSILRISNHRRNNSIREDITHSGLGADEVQTAAAKKIEKTRSKHQRQLSGSLSKADWTQKIYMLVTSGYLLQYSGEGSFDRLPEKMMQLGKDSVAFASDVIPGKHWVLQISQAMDSDGVPAPDPRSLLSRLSFRGADYRRTATSFLLILDSAEDLESWITTVRREIEALGGKKYVSETGKPKVDEEVMRLKAQPSQRFLVQRDPDRFSNPPTPRTSTYEPPWTYSGDVEYQEPTVPSLRTQYVVGPSANRLSVATSSASHDSQPCESLKDNSFRLSYMSSGQRTLVTSQGSTPTCSPTQETFITIAESRIEDYIEEVRPRPNATAISDRRRSMQAMQKPRIQTHALEFHATPKASQPRPHSTYGGLGRPTIVPSPSTPNFSVPHSVSKRYTLGKALDNVSVPPSTRVKTPTKERDPAMKGNRKSPPAPLKAPQLSPVQDYPSPVKQLPFNTPSRSSFQKASSSRPSTAEVPPHSRSGSPRSTSKSAVGSPISVRRSSHIPPKSPRIVQSSIQSPRRQSSLRAFPNVVGDAPKTPVRAPPTQPASPHMVPLPPSPLISPLQLEATPDDDTSGFAISQGNPRVSAHISKPKRPASMQVLTKASTNVMGRTVPPPNGTVTAITLPSAKPTTPSHALLSSIPPQPLSAPHLPSSLSSPSVQRLKATEAKKNLLNRRSMPHLVKGPPPAPPPNYALPPIPPGGIRSPMAFKGNRSSVVV